MISASHNPYEDNGIKFFGRDGFKLADEVEEKMERLIFSGELDSIRPTAAEIGKAYRIDDAVGRYNEFVKSSIPGAWISRPPGGRGLGERRGVQDRAAHPHRARRRRHLLYDQPNGTNINRGCGSLHPEVISRAVAANHAHMGIAYDGDADRAILCDEKGALVDGDVVMAICALSMIKEGKLRHNTLVATVMSNLGLERARGGRRGQAPPDGGGRPLRHGKDDRRRIQPRRGTVGPHHLP